MKALDCCAGAGGLSLGLQRAGFDVLGVELDETACETHVGLVGPCDRASLWDYEPSETYNLVAGGIPCQSHSTAGKRAGACELRGQLYVPFLRIAQQAKAHAVLIENVRGMLTSPSRTHKSAFDEVCAAMREAGFWFVEHRVIDAVDYGVPQHRQRIFVVGFRNGGHARRFSWPQPTHSCNGTSGLLPWATVRQALELGDGAFAHGRLPTAKGRTYQGFRMLNVDEPSPTVSAWSRELLKPLDALARAALPSKAKPRRSAEALCGLGAVRLSVDQLALLQSFPPRCAISGSVAARHRQVGNAVPPPLAEAVGRAVFAAIE